MNTQLLKKMQYALKQKGYLICIPTTQFYNEKSKRFVKVFHIKHYKTVLFSSSSLPKIIKFTAGILKIVDSVNPEDKDKEKIILERIADMEEQYNATQSET